MWDCIDGMRDAGMLDSEAYPWTIALVREGAKEVHFGVFPYAEAARKAMYSGEITVADDESLQLRRIRAFPGGV